MLCRGLFEFGLVRSSPKCMHCCCLRFFSCSEGFDYKDEFHFQLHGMVFMVLNLVYRDQQYTTPGSSRQGFIIGEDEDDSAEFITPIQNGQSSKDHLEMRGTTVL